MLDTNLFDFLGIKIESIDKDSAIASLEVTDRACQIHGFLNGGVSLYLCEVLAGMLSTHVLSDGHIALGSQISASHLNAAKKGDCIQAKATFLKCGKRQHVIEVVIVKDDVLVSKATVTNTII